LAARRARCNSRIASLSAMTFTECLTIRDRATHATTVNRHRVGAHAVARDAARGVEALKRADCRLGGCSLRHGFSEEHAASRTARPQPLASGRRIRRVFAGSFSQHAAPPSAPPAPGAALPQEAWRAVEVPADVLSKILTPPSANVRTTTEGIGGKFHEAEAEATRQALGDEVPPSNRRRASCALPWSGFGAARI
jgi:hypothetical protein